MGNLNHDKKLKAKYACITIVNCFQISNFVLWQTAIVDLVVDANWL